MGRNKKPASAWAEARAYGVRCFEEGLTHKSGARRNNKRNKTPAWR